MDSPISSPISSPIPQPAEFQAHIFNSFLQGKTSDVALRVRASWHAVYKFHRVVLIQAVRIFIHPNTPFAYIPSQEFFRHLFTGGFVESEGKDSSPGSCITSGPIEVVFDDTNITRPGT
jgi:hypothetical protein